MSPSFPLDNFFSERSLPSPRTEKLPFPDEAPDPSPSSSFGGRLGLLPSSSFGGGLGLLPSSSFGGRLGLLPSSSFGGRLGLLPLPAFLGGALGRPIGYGFGNSGLDEAAGCSVLEAAGCFVCEAVGCCSVCEAA